MGLSLKEYITAVGVSKLTKLIEITDQTAYNWRSGASMPSPATANELISISHGILTWESIYKPYFEDSPKEPVQMSLPLLEGSNTITQQQ